MRNKIISILIVFLMLLTSCKQNAESTNAGDAQNTNQQLSQKDISKMDFVDYGLDEKTEQAIENWQEYYQLQDAIDNVKKGDLVFFNNTEAVSTLLKDLKKNIPKPVNTPATLARIQVLETKTYKLESALNLLTTTKDQRNACVKEFLEAFSNLNFQMNKKFEKENNTIQKPK